MTKIPEFIEDTYSSDFKFPCKLCGKELSIV